MTMGKPNYSTDTCEDLHPDCDNEVTHALSVINRAIDLFEKHRGKPSGSSIRPLSPSVCQAPVSSFLRKSLERKFDSVSTQGARSDLSGGESTVSPPASCSRSVRSDEYNRQNSHSSSSTRVDATYGQPSDVNDVEANITYGLELL